jgi:glycosyltransferase involved in cell wall biosynthesis
MKLLHVPFCFYPDPVGGTEIYVDGLAREQQWRGDTVMVAAPAGEDAAYRHDGLPVRRFAINPHVNGPRELYGEGDPNAAAAFARILDDERPDVVHLHAFTSAVSLRLVREAKRRDIPVVFSYHTPTVSCQRGTLLRWGSEICDGVLDVRACARCTLHAHGLAKAASQMAGSLPPGLGHLLAVIGASGGVWTALRMTELVELRLAAFHTLMREADHVVALCQWVKDLLRRNGVPEEKVTVSRQGVPPEIPARAIRTASTASPAFRVAFLGRLHPTKGVHMLVEALRGDPQLPVRLDIFGVAQGEADHVYGQRLATLAAGDARIALRAPIPNGQVVERLQEYDLLAVPSQWLETGPIVVLEAFAAGIPVAGSNLGGIPELVEHGVNGLLIDPASPANWAAALRSLSQDPDLLATLRSRIRPPRTMRDAAAELNAIYSQVGSQFAAVAC